MSTESKNSFRSKRVLALVVILLGIVSALFLWAKWNSAGNVIPATTTPVSVTIEPGTTQEPPAGTGPQAGKYGVAVGLSEGQPPTQTAIPMPLATGEPLSAEEIQQIISRLPTLPPAPDEQSGFNLPQDVLPPPRPGNTIKQSFPGDHRRALGMEVPGWELDRARSGRSNLRASFQARAWHLFL